MPNNFIFIFGYIATFLGSRSTSLSIIKNPNDCSEGAVKKVQGGTRKAENKGNDLVFVFSALILNYYVAMYVSTAINKRNRIVV